MRHYVAYIFTTDPAGSDRRVLPTLPAAIAWIEREKWTYPDLAAHVDKHEIAFDDVILVTEVYCVPGARMRARMGI